MTSSTLGHCIICLSPGAILRSTGCTCTEPRYHIQCLLEQVTTPPYSFVSNACACCRQKIKPGLTYDSDHEETDQVIFDIDSNGRTECVRRIMNVLTDFVLELMATHPSLIVCKLAGMFLCLRTYARLIPIIPHTRFQENALRYGIMTLWNFLDKRFQSHVNYPHESSNAIRDFGNPFTEIHMHIRVLAEFLYAELPDFVKQALN